MNPQAFQAEIWALVFLVFLALMAASFSPIVNGHANRSTYGGLIVAGVAALAIFVLIPFAVG